MAEILAPVGGPAQLEAAVRAGADAVYLGTQGFNARRNAENFSGDSLRQAVSYCHARGVRVHVTVNTIVTDDELGALERELEVVANSGADAVILQDLAAVRLFRERCPGIERHASTQMAVHNADGVIAAREMGFTRVVLARELSLEEIEKLCKIPGIELEVFIHGALCECLSGACYMSAIIGERSGNRGLCAQPCRTDFKCGGRNFVLSLKDLSAEHYMRRLIDAGVASFKIEGRMKRPEYVAAAVTACVKARAGEPYDTELLRSVFSRSGFTDGHLTGVRNADMFGIRTAQDAEDSKAVLSSVTSLYRRERSSLGVDMEFSLLRGKPSALTVRLGNDVVTVSGETAQEAVNSPADAEYVRRSLAKTGGTPFYLENFTANIDKGVTLPASALNSLRREALEKLLEKRSEVTAHEVTPLPCYYGWGVHEPAKKQAVWARFSDLSQLPDDLSAYDRVIVPIERLKDDISGQLAEKLAAELSPAAFPEYEDRQRDMLKALVQKGLKAVYAENIYGVKLGREMGLCVLGGPCLNAANSAALEEYKALGVDEMTVSFELSMSKIKALGGYLPRGALVYGRLPLMRLRACPARGKKGCGNCPGYNKLTDRLGVEFPLVCHEKRFSTVLNSVPLYVGDKNLSGLDHILLYFTTENKNECSYITRACLNGDELGGKKTTGLYYRNVK